MRIPDDHYLIVDVEATCSDDWAVPREEMEIIEIGAVVLCSRTFEIKAEFQTMIRPVRHPLLTEFCTKLTGFTQDDVATAPAFRDAMDAMRAWTATLGDWLFCSWGDYDRNQFLQDCEFHQYEYPFTAGHLNLKAEFCQTLGRRKKVGVTDALRQLGLTFAGSHHRGLDDARNIARIVRSVCVGA